MKTVRGDGTYIPEGARAAVFPPPDFFKYELSKVNAAEAEIPATGNHQSGLLVVFPAGRLALEELAGGAPQAGTKDGRETGEYGRGVEVAEILVGGTGVAVGFGVAEGNQAKGITGNCQPPSDDGESESSSLLLEGTGVLDGVGVSEGVGVRVSVEVEVGVGVSVSVAVGVRVSVGVDVGVSVSVGVGEGVKVLVGGM